MLNSTLKGEHCHLALRCFFFMNIPEMQLCSFSRLCHPSLSKINLLSPLFYDGTHHKKERLRAASCCSSPANPLGWSKIQHSPDEVSLVSYKKTFRNSLPLPKYVASCIQNAISRPHSCITLRVAAVILRERVAGWLSPELSPYKWGSLLWNFLPINPPPQLKSAQSPVFYCNPSMQW